VARARLLRQRRQCNACAVAGHEKPAGEALLATFTSVSNGSTAD
jgi:hypothetical protein